MTAIAPHTTLQFELLRVRLRRRCQFNRLLDAQRNTLHDILSIHFVFICFILCLFALLVAFPFESLLHSLLFDALAAALSTLLLYCPRLFLGLFLLKLLPDVAASPVLQEEARRIQI